MLPQHRTPNHPGEILWEEFLKPLGITQKDFAQRLGISLQRLNGIIRGKRSVTAETALLLSQTFGTTPEFWLGMQCSYDLAKARETVRRVEPLHMESRTPRS